ncbi:VgrG protein [Minicystis rosea]|nr:VgrG protein [Minicystis rosea]
MSEPFMLGALAPQEAGGARVYGVVVGQVIDNNDPDNLGRVKLKFPWISDEHKTDWTRVMTPMAGKERGFFFLPEVGDEVLVTFQFGDVSHPYVLGALWSKEDRPPPTANKGQSSKGERSVNRRVIQSTSGHLITLDDSKGKEKITIVGKGGKDKIEIDSTSNKITIESDKDLDINAARDIHITAGEDVSIQCKKFSLDADQSYELKALTGKIEADSGLDLKCMAGVKINTDGLVVT